VYTGFSVYSCLILIVLKSRFVPDGKVSVGDAFVSDSVGDVATVAVGDALVSDGLGDVAIVSVFTKLQPESADITKIEDINNVKQHILEADFITFPL
jgi:2C-methyl-D-erythritol 2,4-cyclodiphosphate synthase